MSKENNSKIAKIIDSASTAVQQNVPQTIKESDGVLSTVVGFFNNVVLYPVKKANLTFKYKLEKFREDLETKIAQIPQENLQVPPTMIAGPVMESLKYTYDEEELRDMYENLLASAMDNRFANKAHPSFVETIKQMSPLDSIVLKAIVNSQQLKCYNIVFTYEEISKKVYTYGMPDYFVEELAALGDIFAVSSSIINLKRLGLIVIRNGAIRGENYSLITENQIYLSRLNHFNSLGKEIKPEFNNMTIEINNYGQDFAKTCIKTEDKHNAD